MATPTTKLGLLKPDGTDVWNQAAYDNTNWDRIDSTMGVTECTSTTRPASPYAGMILRETDTLRIIVRNAANNAWMTTNGSVPIVNNTSDITTPINGMVVLSFTGFGLWLYKSSASAWVPLTHDDYYTLRQGTNTSISAGWTAIPFATTVEGSNQGITTSDNITYTFTQNGVWHVKATIIPNGNAACVAALFRGTASADPLNAGNTEVYSMVSGGNAGSVAGVTCSADIRVDGGSTKTVRCSAFASGLSLFAAGNPGRSRLTFCWSPA